MTDLLALVLALRLVLGIVAVGLMGWVVYGFRYVSRPSDVFQSIVRMQDATKSELMAASLAVFHIKGMFRLLYWDVITIVLAVLEIYGNGSLYVSIVNLPFIALAIAGSILALGSQYKAIPDGEREGYTIWTAPRYPWAKLALKQAMDRATEPRDEASDWRHRAANAETNLYALARAVVEHRDDDATNMARAAFDRHE